MKQSYLANFRSLDPEAFGLLMRHLGFASAAAYRFADDMLVQVLCAPESDAEMAKMPDPSALAMAWPAAVEHRIHYSASARPQHRSQADKALPVGWAKEFAGRGSRKVWPKGVNLYFPEQELESDLFVIATVSATGKRCRAGEMSGPLEAVGSRLRLWFRESRERGAIIENGLREHIRTLGVDLQLLVDHELRTPLASISGYAVLLRDGQTARDPEAVSEFSGIVEKESYAALEAVEKLSLVLSAEHIAPVGAPVRLDAARVVKDLCSDLKERAFGLISQSEAQKLSVRFRQDTDFACTIDANLAHFKAAVWEVLKNAVMHARGGHVEVVVYTQSRMLVVDVIDDGHGVSAGAEELIFLRFYQDPNVALARRGKKGLGLGLFLARHLVERHLGQLVFLRQRNSTLFRFLWPLAAVDDAKAKNGFPKGA